jgi:hypothetical protein
MTRIALLVLACTTGCLFGDGDDECLYYYDTTGAADIAAWEYRNPITGTCESYGDPYCNDPCKPCPGAGIAQPDWAQCYSSCENLDEATCKSTPGCRAAYNESTFYQCWGTAPSGPVQGTCTGLDAQECSRHDDCVAIHAAGTPIGSFLSCAAEGTVQDPGSCVGTVTCATPPPQCPMGTIAGRRNGCWTGYCIPYAQCDQLPACSTLDEMDCIARTDCAPTYEGIDCTCTMTGCTCQSWLFDSCKMK